ncbi:MAG TPA: PaaI family thioesterase [Baekduia sp.]|nr:PaaI family thioesterase [Baekduia sp.]
MPDRDRETAQDDWLPPHHERCLGCGPGNPAGFGLRARRAGDRVHCEVTLGPDHAGAPGYAHGGAVATILDDAFGFVAMLGGRPAVTARLEVDYRAPVLLGVPLTIEAWDEAPPGDRKRRLRGILRDPEGTVLAEANGLFVVVDPSHFHAGAGGMPEHWRRVPW